MSSVWRRSLLFGSLNLLYFGSLLVGALLAQAGYVGFYEVSLVEGVPVEEVGGWLMVLDIFVLNMVLTAFIVTTLSGLVFFVFPVVVLLWRAVLWGALLNGLSTPLFLAALPTMVLEGEGYVLAGAAGVKLGLSWLMPKWTYGEEEKDLSRVESVKKALKETARIYVFVIMFLLVAAIVEMLTLILTQLH